MLKIIGESLLIATRMDRVPDAFATGLPDDGEAVPRSRKIIRLPRFWQ